MDRDDLAFGLLLSVPVAAGVALAVLKQTLGSRPDLAAAAGVTAAGAIFALVQVARRAGAGPDVDVGLRTVAERLVPEGREADAADLLLAAGLGAVVTVFLWYIPLSPMLGGAVAGFVQGGSREDARTAGTLSGALVPLVVGLFAVVVFLAVGATVVGRFPFGPLAAVALSVAGTVYAVGLGTVGGWIGGMALEDRSPWGKEAS